jgi:hypothetical protein
MTDRRGCPKSKYQGRRGCVLRKEEFREGVLEVRVRSGRKIAVIGGEMVEGAPW